VELVDFLQSSISTNFTNLKTMQDVVIVGIVIKMMKNLLQRWFAGVLQGIMLVEWLPTMHVPQLITGLVVIDFHGII